MHAMAETDPLQQVSHIFAIIIDALTYDAQGQRHVFPGCQVIEQAEILEDNADAASQLCPLLCRYTADVLIEHLDLAVGGMQ